MRAETLRVVVVERADFLVLFDVVGIKIVTGFVERADTFVFSGVRDAIVRVARAVVVLDFVVLDTVFSPRTAQSAPDTQNRHAQTKSKNFFISCIILAKT